MRNDLTDEKILALIEQEETLSYGINDAELSDSRSKAIDYYNGKPFGNEIDGRSQVVSRDVLDVIESALPQILKIFVSGDEVVKFEPKNEQDIDAAEQETDYVNHVVMEKNDGFFIFYTWFKDALLSKNGYVKAYYEEIESTEAESYRGLTDNQLTMLARDERVSVVQHSMYPDPIASQQRQQAIAQAQQAAAQNPEAGQQLEQLMQTPEPMLHDVKIEVRDKKSCITITNVAPEDILVSTDCREVSLSCARFVQHRAIMSKADVEKQGWDLPDNWETFSDMPNGEEADSRNLYSEEQQNDLDRDELMVRDTYLRIDGVLMRYVVCGSHVMHREECEIIPFATVTPHIMPHRHIGMSYADLCVDIQEIKSSVIRGQLDNIALSNNGRYAVSDRVNLSDMLTSRPGGIVRVQGDPGSAIMPLSHTPFPPTSFSVVEYMDSIKEKRTGITAYNQGLNADSLNKTASGISQIMSAAIQRIELVARTFAETGVKELFMLVHRLVRKHYTKPDIVRLRDKWIDVDPREWSNRSDMSIAVGLGTGNKDQQMSHLSNMFQMQMGLLQAGLPIITPENLFNTMRQIAINSGFKQAEQFVTSPEMLPPPQPPPPDPALQMKQMDIQADQQKTQATAALKMQELQMKEAADEKKLQATLIAERQQAEFNMQQELARSSNDVAIEREKIESQMALERYKAELKAETDIKIAMINAEIKEREMQRQAEEDSRRDAMEQQRHDEQISAMTRPKKIVKGPDGRPSGVE